MTKYEQRVLDELKARVEQLENAIRSHRMDTMVQCIVNPSDRALYEVLDD